MDSKIIYLQSNELIRQLHKLSNYGGASHTAAKRVQEIMGKMCYDSNPFHGVQETNHGESRIKNCVKYALTDGHRLITIQCNKHCFLAFVGTHDECERWLERHRGLTLISKNNEYDFIVQSGKIDIPTERIQTGTDFIQTSLIDRLNTSHKDKFLDLLPGSAVRLVNSLTTHNSDDTIIDSIARVDDENTKRIAFDVLVLLREGDVEGAIAIMDVFFGVSKPINSLDNNEIIKIDDGERVRKIPIDSPEYFKWISKYIQSSTYKDWMLFMHPIQEKVAYSDYSGATKLSGVSGSGKTCVVVMRAIYLAKKSVKNNVLVVALNKSLAELIWSLLNAACHDESVISRIECKSFFKLCQELLHEFEPENDKLFNDFTWKTNEHIDEIWREFYRCEVNNNSADIFLPIHKSLNKQGINAEEYIRQEIDWIRSSIENREDYLTAERKGRGIPLLKGQRELILKGLLAWEEKMLDIGAVDPVGIASALVKYRTKIVPRYDSILIDEVQDFGTLELSLLRMLVAQGENDLFLVGDMAQHILPKHQSFSSAGVTIPGARSLKFEKNYRNSREILRAAYEVFINNLESEVILDGDLELLDPKFANFSTPKPYILKAATLEDEVSFAISIADEYILNNPDRKVCIAFAGYTQLEVAKFALKSKKACLNGLLGIDDNSILFSDLDQTKGYEFDLMIILNCENSVLPSDDSPYEEHYRDLCRFYVAMTRAKLELYISYHSNVSSWIDSEKCRNFFDFSLWSENFDFNGNCKIGTPEKLPQVIQDILFNPLKYNGKQFIRTNFAQGVSLELQNKIEILIDGVGLSRGSNRIKWKTILDAYEDVKKHPHAKALFGENTWREFVDCIERHFSLGSYAGQQISAPLSDTSLQISKKNTN